MILTRFLGLALLLSATLFGLNAVARHADDKQASLAGPAAKTPEEEKKTFQLAPGLQIDLVASEPQIVDPVALAFDESGRLFVAEMRGYPNGGVGRGDIRSGTIQLLEDR